VQFETIIISWVISMTLSGKSIKVLDKDIVIDIISLK